MPTAAGAPDRRRLGWLWAGAVLFAVSTFLAFTQSPRPNPLQPSAAFPSLDWWKHPIERNAMWRLDGVTTDIHGVFALPDGRHAWAVGSNGTILATADGGASWGPQTSNTTEDLYSVAFVDAQRGWAVGRRGMILATADGGASWAPQTSNTTKSLNSVAFVDQQRGWAVGRRGTILATADGGASWAPQTSHTTEDLYSVAFVDQQRCWAVGRRGMILATADGGASWAPRTSNTTELLRSVAFVDAQRGWAVGWNGTILATADGGASWGPQTSHTTERLESVAFVDQQRGWAVGRNGPILATVDGGASWAPQTSNTTESLFSVGFVDQQRGWAVGSNGTILATADGGASWAPQTSHTTEYLYSVAFVDAQRGWAVGANGRILATADGGASWEPRTSNTTEYLYSVAFVDAQRGWAVGSNGTILATADGGASWAPRTSNTTVDLDSVAFVDQQRGWAVGRRGTILATADGGASWAPQTSNTTEWLGSVAFVDAQRGWAVGSTILATSDGGASWAPRTSHTTEYLYSVGFVDAQRGWAVGGNGTILATTDGGASWAPQTTNTTEYLYSVAFVDAQRGWAVGERGTILATADGGASWVPRTSNTTEYLLSVGFVDQQRAWAVGQRGTILATADGGTSWGDARLPYDKWPAPWYYLTLLGVGLLIRESLRRPAPIEQPAKSVEDRLLSDRPLESPRQDVLDLQGIALSLSRFLRNENTQPPLTIAITGEWGSGKSSLMNLLQRDLERWGFRPVWFNAWHHQKEEYLLPSLLQSIRAQAAPSLWRPEGWGFRLRLLSMRGWRHWVPSAIVVGVFSASLAGFIVQGGPSNLPGSLAEVSALLKSLYGVHIQKIGTTLTVIVSAIGLLTMLTKALKAFGVNPARLLATESSRASSRDLNAKTHFRRRFATEFKDVTEALGPRRMLIFIDDLDRCQPENVLDVLEGVNFLVSSGDCYVVMGLSRNQVEACVGLGFKEIAEEVEAFEGKSPETSAGDQRARERRIEYARQYLRKLINIEIPVPKVSGQQAQQLLTGGQAAAGEEATHPLSWKIANRAWAALKPALPIAALALVTAGPFYLVQWWDEQSKRPPAAPIVVAPGTGGGDSGSATPGLAARGQTAPGSLSTKQEQTSDVVFIPGQEPTGKPLALILLLALPVFLVAAWWAFGQRPELIVKDSPDFQKALEIWRTVIHSKATTPRDLKRFLNRLRYLAMRQRPQEPTATYGEKVLEKLASVLGKRTTKTPGEDPRNTLPESHLVALAALDASGLVESKNDFQKALTVHRIRLDEGWYKPLTVFEEAIERHKAAFEEKSGALSQEHRTAYLQLAAGIHVD